MCLATYKIQLNTSSLKPTVHSYIIFSFNIQKDMG